MKSKIDIYNYTMTLACAISVVFAAGTHSVVWRIFCAVAALGLLGGIVAKIRKGGEEDA